MKIAFITTMDGVPWGGSEELWFEAAKAAIAEKHEILVSAPKWGNVDKHYLELEGRGAQLHFRERRVYSTHLAQKIVNKIKHKVASTFENAFSAVKKFNPDVICLSQGGSYNFLWMPELTNFLATSKLPYTLICQCNIDTPFTNENDRQAVKIFYENALWVGFVSQGNLDAARRHLASPIPNAVVLRNPVNLTDISVVEFQPTSKTVRFANVARLDTPHKGQDILLEALSRVTWRDEDWHLSFFGGGPDLNYLGELAEYFKLSDKVTFHGSVSDIRRIWQDHLLLVMPSRYEGTPLALVEAMLCGRTAIVTDVAGNCEWVEDKTNGFVAESASPTSLLKALEQAWSMRNEWEMMGDSARKTALRLYNPKAGEFLLELLLNNAIKVSRINSV